MYCQNRIIYTVQAGDSLYQLSRQYHTTVTELILGNPGVNPYNLQIGMRLNICPGEGYTGPEMNRNPNPNEQTPGQMENAVESLMEAMRMAWIDLIFWNRMYLMSVTADARDQQQLEERAMQAADEITDVFARHLPVGVTRQLRTLLAEHVELTGEIARTLKSGNMENYDNLIKQWYANANQIATLLGNQNPYFGGRETRNMLLNYLDMTREAMEHQVNGEYGESIDTFRDLKNQVLEMADYFARGLLAR